MIYKDMALRASYRYVDKLDEILNIYNNKKHRTIGVTPNKAATKKSEKILQQTVYKNERPFVKNPRFKVGQFVRVSKYKNPFDKGYFSNYSSAIYKIHSVNRKFPNSYRLSDYYGKNILLGSFYDQELLPTKHPDLFLVEKILQKKKVNGVDMVLIKWSGYDEPTWEKKSNILEPEK
jgi:hypothetical protein